MFNRLPAVTKLADIGRIEERSVEDYVSYNSTYEILADAAKTYANRLALRFLLQGLADEVPQDISYKELYEKVTQTANLFNELGLRSQDCVSYILPNLPQTHFVIWGGQAAGIVNAVNPLLEASIIAQILNEAECRILVTLAPTSYGNLWEKVEGIIGQVTSITAVLQVDLDRFNPSSKKKSKEKFYMPRGTERIPVMDLDQEIAKQPVDRLIANRRIERDEIAAYFHTGGTTGTPKLALHSHYNQVCNAYVVASLSYVTDQDIYLAGLPLFHVNAVILTGLGAFIKGATVVILTPQGYRSPNVLPNFWILADKFKANIFSCVPTILAALLRVPKENKDISSLKYAFCGAAPLSVKLFNDFEYYSGVQILEGYGLTESTCVASTTPPQAQPKIGSIGMRIPFQQAKAVLLDEQGNYLRDCDVDEVGILVLRGPNIFPGYKQSERNNKVFLEGGWLNSGDLARIDNDGYIWLAGREKDLIIRGGHNIDPGLIEGALSGHPAVELVAVIGQPDAYAGELPCAYVSVNATVTTDEILAYAKRKIPERAAIPVYIEIVDTMPLTAVGKIFKPELRRLAIKRVFTEALSNAGVEAEVEVMNDSRTGLMVELTTDTAKLKVDEVLGGFSISYRLR